MPYKTMTHIITLNQLERAYGDVTHQRFTRLFDFFTSYHPIFKQLITDPHTTTVTIKQKIRVWQDFIAGFLMMHPDMCDYIKAAHPDLNDPVLIIDIALNDRVFESYIQKAFSPQLFHKKYGVMFYSVLAKPPHDTVSSLEIAAYNGFMEKLYHNPTQKTQTERYRTYLRRFDLTVK